VVSLTRYQLVKGKRDAMAMLADAAGCCFDEDVRQRPELRRALEYLARETDRAVYVNRFRKALDVSTSRSRCFASRRPRMPTGFWSGALD